MADGHGGARAGAGRKPVGERFASKIAGAEKRIADRLPQLIDNMVELADGVRVVDPDRDPDEEGNPRVYHKPPDYKANEYLLNRIMGKPTERQEVSGADGAPIRVVVEYEDADPPAPA